MIAVFNGLVAAPHIVDSGIRHTLRDSGTMLVHQANLFTKRIGILLDLGKLLSRDILQLSETLYGLLPFSTRLRLICTMADHVGRRLVINAVFIKSLKGRKLVGGRERRIGRYSPLRRI